MALWGEGDVGAVIPLLRGLLDHPIVEVKPDECIIRGTIRDHAIRVRCWDRLRGSGWVIVLDLPDPPRIPLWLGAWRSPRGRRDPSVATGDARFDAAWYVVAAPGHTAREVLDDAVRATMSRLGRGSHAHGAHRVVRTAPALLVGRDDVRIESHGRFEAAEVGAGVELAALVGDRVAAIAEARRISPPSSDTIAADEAALARLHQMRRPIWVRRPRLKVAAYLATIALVTATWAIRSADCRAKGHDDASPPPDAGLADSATPTSTDAQRH